MTSRAQQWIEEYLGWASSVERLGLPDTLQRWVTHQERLFNQDSDAPPSRLPFLVERAEKKLVIRLFTDSHTGQHTLLLNKEQSSVSPKALVSRGLTLREADVLFWVMQGKTNMEVATILSMRPRTVHKHLEHIYQKLGVETRTAAAMRAAEALGLLRM